MRHKSIVVYRQLVSTLAVEYYALSLATLRYTLVLLFQVMYSLMKCKARYNTAETDDAT